MCSQKDFTIAIVGGGFVGLVCAIELARAGIPVNVFEATSGYGDIGAGVGIGPNALRVLKHMGIADEIESVLEDQGPHQSLMTFVRGEDVHHVVYQYPSDKRKDQGLAVHRAAFLNALLRVVPSNVKSHLNKRCVSVSTMPDGRARVRFADGTEHIADVVVGADGIKSVVRAHALGDKDDRLVDTLCCAYRTLVPMQQLLDAGVDPELLKPHARCWMGNGKHIIMYPVSSGTMLNIAAFTTDRSRPMQPAGPKSSWSTWVSPAPLSEVLSAFSDFGPDAKAILGCIDVPSKWAVHGMYPPMDTYVGRARTEGESRDRPGMMKVNAVLVGDAAHAMLPHLGAGAGAGIEDAFVLARLLAHPQTKRRNLNEVLRAYDSVRVPRGAYIANASKRAEDAYQGRGPNGSSDAGRRKDLTLQWERVWEHDAQTDVQRAIGALVARGVFFGPAHERVQARL
ncbi:unnamed protein product [Peniophora sp. CBMAI 1063]|nr:unnamed protein product [Peniophora sp. CBMAI 1063]